jgi:hypothetical protein
MINCTLAINASYGCFFVQSNNPFDRFGNFQVGMGLFSREDLSNDGYSCIVFNQEFLDEILDGPYLAARIFGIMANICFGVTMIMLVCISSMSFWRDFVQFAAICSAGGFIFQSLTFLIFASDVCDDCDFSIGGGLAIASAVIGLCNACLIFNLPRSDVEKEGGVEQYRSTGSIGATAVRGEGDNEEGKQPHKPQDDQPLDNDEVEEHAEEEDLDAYEEEIEVEEEVVEDEEVIEEANDKAAPASAPVEVKDDDGVEQTDESVPVEVKDEEGVEQTDESAPVEVKDEEGVEQTDDEGVEQTDESAPVEGKDEEGVEQTDESAPVEVKGEEGVEQTDESAPVEVKDEEGVEQTDENAPVEV